MFFDKTMCYDTAMHMRKDINMRGGHRIGSGRKAQETKKFLQQFILMKSTDKKLQSYRYRLVQAFHKNAESL